MDLKSPMNAILVMMKIFNNKLYFTNWNTNDIKILNLDNYVIEESIQVNGKPESIEIYDMQGVLVETLNTLGDRNDIELSTNDWKLGIYQVVLLQSDGTISVQNIIKQ